MSMSSAKIDRMLDGQTQLARKVFEMVPIQEAWDARRIADAVRSSGLSSAACNVIRACLGDLHDNGLIKQPSPHHFQRQPSKIITTRTPAMTLTTKTTPNPVNVATPDTVGASTSPLELLGDLSGEVLALADDFTRRLQALSKRIEDTALVIEQGQERFADKVEKFAQLQSLLKSLA